jgi:hypothetical protein
MCDWSDVPLIEYRLRSSCGVRSTCLAHQNEPGQLELEVERADSVVVKSPMLKLA